MNRRPALAAVLILSALGLYAPPSQAQLFVGVQVRIGPPPLPVYVQPPLPGPDYIWTPGYWAWDADAGDYYWVPGTWVRAPRPGYLWTPGYWGWSDGFYVFHAGYWGPHIGYYGGVVYGFGYTGFGYEGGYWRGPHYCYNRTVNNVNITNVYNKTVIVNRTTVNNVSYSGGPGGVAAQPTPAQLEAAREPHLQPTPVQTQHLTAARADRTLFASANHGAPPVAATLRPAQLRGEGVVRAQPVSTAPNEHVSRTPEPSRPALSGVDRREYGVRPEAVGAAPVAAQLRPAPLRGEGVARAQADSEAQTERVGRTPEPSRPALTAGDRREFGQRLEAVGAPHVQPVRSRPPQPVRAPAPPPHVQPPRPPAPARPAPSRPPPRPREQARGPHDR